MTTQVHLHIAGSWRAARSEKTSPIIDPASGKQIGFHSVADIQDLDEAISAAERGFETWRKVPAFDRSKVLRKAAGLLRERSQDIACIMTLEQGKPLAEATGEVLVGADTIDWFAEEGRRAYGRIIPARGEGIMQLVTREPVGPVACFTPWNFPIIQSVRKVAAALSTGCSVILKGPEDAPSSCAEMVRAFLDAGVPADALGFVLGVPADISSYLISSPVIRKISFTGSTTVGKQLAALAGKHMKRSTMELGGHAPAIVFKDANVGKAAELLSIAKFRNAGQVCISPSRLLVHESIADEFTNQFVRSAKAIKVGNGLDPSTTMGPLIGARRVEAMEMHVADAVANGAELRTGGKRIGTEGFFFEPTVLSDVPRTALVMNEEPFGPIATITRFSSEDEAIAEANRLPLALASYLYTRSIEISARVSSKIVAGMVSVNHQGLGLPENPFGGVRDSGYGLECGMEGLEPYLVTKFTTQMSG